MKRKRKTMKYTLVTNPASAPTRRKKKMAARKTKRVRRSRKASVRRRNPVAAFQAAATKTNPSRKRRRTRRNPALIRNARRRNGGIRAKRNPSAFMSLLSGAAIAGATLSVVNILSRYLPLPQQGLAKTAGKAALAYAVHRFGKKVVSQQTADAVAMLIIAQEVVEWVTPYVGQLSNSVTGLVRGATNGAVAGGSNGASTLGDVYERPRALGDVYEIRAGSWGGM